MALVEQWSTAIDREATMADFIIPESDEDLLAECEVETFAPAALEVRM